MPKGFRCTNKKAAKKTTAHKMEIKEKTLVGMNGKDSIERRKGEWGAWNKTSLQVHTTGKQ